MRHSPRVVGSDLLRNEETASPVVTKIGARLARTLVKIATNLIALQITTTRRIEIL